MTKLKKQYASEEEIPETFRLLFRPEGDKFIRDIEFEGDVPKKALDDMRDTSIRERQEHEDALKVFEGVDVAKWKDLLSREKDLEDGKLLKRGELEAVIKPRVEEALKPKDAEIATLKGDNAVLRNRLETAIIENQVVQAALPLGLKKGAAPDLIERARKVFRLNDDGEVVAYEKDGKTVKYHMGSEDYTLQIFAKELAADENGKHLFEDNQGAGGEQRRGQGGYADNGINPWNPTTLNRAMQSLIITKDFAQAKRMAAKHGITLKEPVSLASR